MPETAGQDQRPVSLYDLQRPGIIADPWPLYRSLLARSGPVWDGRAGCWLVARHADVAALLVDRRLSAAMDHGRIAAIAPEPTRHWYPLLDAHVSFVDPPVHTRLRAALSGPFRAAALTNLGGFVTALARDAVTRAAAAGRMDVVADLAWPLPLAVMAHMLSLSVDLADLRRWSSAWGQVVAAPAHLPTGDTRQLRADANGLIHYLRGVVHSPAPGTFASRIAAELSETEAVAALQMLVTAGHETTANLIGNAAAHLLDHPADADLLRTRPDLLGAAVDELGRLYPPTQYTARTVTEEVQVGRQVIPAGASVVLMLAASCRDPDAFPDPDTFRLDRPASPAPLTFGRGIHACFGAPLARLETAAAIGALLAGCADLRPAGTRRWRGNPNLRGLDSLPITFRPTGGTP
jgi:cytochrome P450